MLVLPVNRPEEVLQTEPNVSDSATPDGITVASTIGSLGELDSNGNLGTPGAYIAEFNAQSIKQWARLLGTTEDETAYSAAVNSKGDIHRRLHPLASLDGNVSDTFLVKYDASDTKVWTCQLTTNEPESLGPPWSYGPMGRLLAGRSRIQGAAMIEAARPGDGE